MSHVCIVYLDEGISGHIVHVSALAGSLTKCSDLSSAGLVQKKSTSC